MKIDLFTDSLPQPFTDALDWVVEQGIEAVEVGTGNFSPARHCDLDKLHNDENARKEFSAAIEGRGLTLSALNCNGNLLDPHPERRKTSQDVYFKTVELADKLGLDTCLRPTPRGRRGSCCFALRPNLHLQKVRKRMGRAGCRCRRSF